MRLSSLFITAVPFAIAAGLSVVAAGGVATVIEENSELNVRRSLDAANMEWAEVHADGLQVFLTGTAPSEATRFKALSVSGTVVDAARVIDQMTVRDSASLEAPRFSIEILRNDRGISLIGLIPAEMDREKLLKKVRSIAKGQDVSDLLQSADYEMPEDWEDSVDFALDALKQMPRSKISVEAGEISVRAMADSADAKRKLESSLSRAAGHDLELAMDISAPRPVITPFTLRLLLEDGKARFDACSAPDDVSKTRILKAARQAGLVGTGSCTIGLGVPSPRWSQAVEMSFEALTALGGGSVTFADADVTLVAAEGTAQGQFDRIVGELENNLPPVFSLHPVLPKPEEQDGGEAPEFVATLSPEGLLQLRGRLGNELSRTATESFAHARFGSNAVHVAARLDDALPRDWSTRVLAGLEALSHLSNGAVTVTEEMISVHGNTGEPEASAEIAGLLAGKLGDSSRFDIAVNYLEKLDPVASIPTPDECEASISEILSNRKINFEPGSDTPDAEARVILDDIAEVLKLCGEIKMEISGHTDSQGRESMNLALSQSRATAVLNGLRERRVLTSSFSAKGYGEARPIADNDTEEGRDANRRIEFKLIRPKPTPEDGVSAMEAMTAAAEEEAAETGEATAEDAQEGTTNDQN